MKILLEYDTEAEKSDWYTLKEAITLETIYGDLTIPENFITDFSSIPHSLQGFVFLSAVDRDAPADLAHDWLYVNLGITVDLPQLSRKEVDMLWLELMKKYNLSFQGKIRTYVKYGAVRVFGWFYWKNYHNIISGLFKSEPVS